jgi:hypothetical protein
VTGGNTGGMTGKGGGGVAKLVKSVSFNGKEELSLAEWAMDQPGGFAPTAKEGLRLLRSQHAPPNEGQTPMDPALVAMVQEIVAASLSGFRIRDTGGFIHREM